MTRVLWFYECIQCLIVDLIREIKADFLEEVPTEQRSEG